MPRKLKDMTVVITGASSGIGAALARQLDARGARMVLAARRVERLEALNAELGGRHVVVGADVGVEEDCRALVERAFGALGRVDTMVMNAGYGDMRPVAEMTPELIRANFATNLIGTTEPVRVALPRLLAQGPRDGWRAQVMVVSSGAARRGLPMFGVYSATKAAQLSVAEAMRVELRDQRVAVTTVHPVGTTTEFFEVAEGRGGRKMKERTVGDVTQTPERVAAAMVRGIERPRPEVWPFRPARWMLTFATLCPGVADRVMERARKQM